MRAESCVSALVFFGIVKNVKLLTFYLKNVKMLKVIKMIKEILKKNNITLLNFAKQLGISRQTLDTYIRIYESGEELPNQKYQILFDRFFKDVDKSQDEFVNQVEVAEYLIERDSLLGTLKLDAERTDLLTNIIETAKDDLYRQECDVDMYRFVVMFFNSYYKTEIFQHLVKYFLTLNGVVENVSLSKKEQIAISNYYRLFRDEIEGKLQVDEEALARFYARVDEISQIKLDKENEIKKQIKLIVSEKVKDLIDQGIDVDDIDVKTVIKEMMEDYDE